MSSTIDASVLLYASDSASDVHDRAQSFLREWSSGPDLVYIFWPTVMSYLRIATHARIFENPLGPDMAEANITSLLRLPHVRTGAEDERFWETWRSCTSGMVIRGNLVPDAHVVALMRQHGVSEIWTRDRDMRKFEGIKTRDPFSMPR